MDQIRLIQKQIEDAMNNHIIAETKLEGRYSP